jgi:phage terminase large subunit-like protein
MGRPGIVARDTEELHSAIDGGAVTLDNQPLFRSHFLNARRRPGTGGVQLRKEHPQSDRKIDFAVASVLAYAVALEARRAGADKPKAPTHVPYRIL